MVETDEYTGNITNHAFRACTNESGHQGNIVWIDFIKVARNKEDADDNNGDNGKYGVIIGVKTQM